MSRMDASQELQRRLSQELGDRVRLGGFVYPLLLAAVGLQTTIPQEHFWFYFSGLLLTVLAAAWRTIAANKVRKSSAEWQSLLEELRVSSMLMAGLWSTLAGFGLGAYRSSDEAIVFLFALIGWASIGANVFAPDLKLAMAYIHLNFIPAVVWCFLVQTRFGWVMLGVFIVIWASLLLLANRTHAHIRSLTEASIKLEIQAQELVAARDEAESSARSRIQFVTNISHEIRTPLNGILAVADLMSETKLDEEQREWMGIIAQSGRLLLTLVNDLLDLSKIKAGKLVIENVDYDVRRLLEDVCRPMQIAAEEKGLDWRVKIRKEVPEICNGDPFRLSQVLNNLMSNALKFTSRGGVTVDLGMTDGKWMRFVIEDTGIGIEADKLPGIFEEFEQADRETTRRFGGTGLGLTISKKLIENMGGRIGVQSVPHQGSMFWFELPVTSESRS